MKLIVFPGIGSPHNPKYASVYRLIEQSAPKYGYDSVEILQWRGQNDDGVLTLDGALAEAKTKFDSETTGFKQFSDIHILARSFGCFVALKLALDCQPKNLRKMILWGPPPFWLVWEMFLKDFKINQKTAHEKGTRLDEGFYPSIVPIEYMLPLISYETTVATGENDPYVPQSFVNYLESLVKQRKNTKNCQCFHFKEAVPGACHEVTEDAPAPVIEAYLKALFE